MQTVISRSGQVRQKVAVPLILVAGVMFGGVGGYLISGLQQTAWGASAAVQTGDHESAIARSVARHAATEREEAYPGAFDIAISMTRHAAQERDEANLLVSSNR